MDSNKPRPISIRYIGKVTGINVTTIRNCVKYLERMKKKNG